MSEKQCTRLTRRQADGEEHEAGHTGCVGGGVHIGDAQSSF